MTDVEAIKVVFFDLGDTLGAPLLSPPPVRLVDFEVFPWVDPLLSRLRRRPTRLGIISNTGDDSGATVDDIVARRGLLTHFDEAALRIYSADTRGSQGNVLTKRSREIFRLAAHRARESVGSCLYVGEDSSERATAIDAGMRACPHPALVEEVLAGEVLRFVRLVAPAARAATPWSTTLRGLAVVPLRLTGSTLYAITSERLRAQLMSSGLTVETLGDPNAPLREDLFLLRDDVAREQRVANGGQAPAVFRNLAATRLAVGSGDGVGEVVLALPAGRDLNDFHFRMTRHGHTVKLTPQLGLLDAWRERDPARSAWGAVSDPAALGARTSLADGAREGLDAITAPRLLQRVERYSGKQEVEVPDPSGAKEKRVIRSRHAAHPDNPRAVMAIAQELRELGPGALAVRLHRFTHRGTALYNIEAELAGTSAEIVIVSAHLDSTAASGDSFRPAEDLAPGADDDCSGVAAVLTIAECFVAMAKSRPPTRGIRFVLFNAEEEGLVGSQAYASYQRSIDAPIVAVLQMDMIGYNKELPRSWEIHAGFSRSADVESRSVALGRMIAQLAAQVSPELEPPQLYRSKEVYQGDPAEDRSDHAAFQAHGYTACISSEDLFAGPGNSAPVEEGNPDYHQPTDTFVDPEYAADIARAVAATAWHLAAGSETVGRDPGIARHFGGGTAKLPAELDVAVIGGGVSGAYAAWRLREDGATSPLLRQLAEANGGRLRVGLFEYGDRIGGRLYSVQVPGVPDVPIELGGMRFLTSHVRVGKLVTHLGLERRELPVQDPNGRSLFYLRGRHFTAADWERPGFVPPYLLDRSERSRSPGKLLIEVALRHRERTRSLRDVGFRNLMLDEMSAEAYQLIRDASGYDTLVNNWSAAEAIPFLLADFDPSLKYYALRNGFQQVPRELVNRFERAGGMVARRHRLHRLDREPGGRIRLTFDVGASPPVNARRPVETAPCTASHVILALPRASIEGLHPDSVIFDHAQFCDDLQAVLPQPGFKIFTAYRRPWWFDAHKTTAGRSVTDLPLRQCYYWATRGIPDGGNQHESQNSLLMASYSDGGSVEFWAGLARDSEPYRPPVHACPPGVPILDPDAEVSASRAMVAELQDQLRELHGLSTITDPAAADIIAPYAAYHCDWTRAPYGGGWHFWRIGADAAAVMRRMLHPAADRPIYVCGEAWSRQQGWVEGALESADELIESVLRVPPPRWRT